MAGASQKKIAERNRSIVSSHQNIYAAVLAFYIFYRIAYNYSTFTYYHGFWFAFINTVNLTLFFQMKSMSLSGGDLGQEGGLLSFYYDILYIGWFVLIAELTIVFFWAYVFVPLIAVYKLKTLVSSFFGKTANTVKKEERKKSVLLD
ncbi:hypothetical protein HDV01_006790 [Terramyces sp. JEL0728]|nr:hypothetical protein HDV01_006790 [Terramyces sp. JEL0728]